MTLNAGDIAFVGYITNGSPDSFSFLALAPIAAGEVIYFTDNGWTGTGFRGSTATDGDGNENLIRFTANSIIAPGTVIRSTDTTSTNFTWTITGAIGTTTAGAYNNLSLGQSGEQITAFQSTNPSNPLFDIPAITALAQVDNTGVFENATSSSEGSIVTGLLQSANTAVLLNNFTAAATNGSFNLTTALPTTGGTKAQWLAAINTPANWTFSNATTLAATSVTINSVATLGLTVTNSSFSEGAGVNASVATLTRNTDTSNTLTVTLSVDDTSEASVPSTVTFGAGQSSVSFNIAAVDDSIVDGSQAVVLTAAATGFTSGISNLTVTDNDVATLGLTVTNSSFSEGAGANASVATLTRNTNTSSTLTVSLSIDDTSEASVPSSVTFGAGQSSVSFNIDAVDDNIFDGSQNVVLTASKSGFANGTANLTVTDNEVPTLSVSVVGNSFSEAAGNGAAIGTVTRTGSAFNLSTPLQVNVTSGDVSEVTIGFSISPNPGFVTILAGQTSANFAVNAVDDSIVDGSQSVLLTAAATGFATSTTTLTVTDDDLGLTLSKLLFSEGAGYGASSATLTRGDTSGTLTVSLSIDDTTEATVPSSVTFADGENSLNFFVSAVDDSIVDGSQSVVLTAAATGFANSTANLTVTDNETIPYVRNNFGTDNKSDILWRNSSTGEAYLYQMNNFAISSESSLGIVGSEWKISGTGDLNGDGRADVVWRNSNTDLTYAWLMDGNTKIAEAEIRIVGAEWELSGTGDFNGDGKSDLVWRNSNTNATYIYIMDAFSITSEGEVATTKNADWKIAGTGDFNGDQKSDLLWRNSVTGETTISLMDGKSIISEASLTTKSPDFKIEGVDDFNGDGKSDILWRDSVTGDTRISLLNGISVVNDQAIGDAGSDYKASYWSITGTGDYNGDSKADILWSNTNGQTYIWNMNGLALIGEGGVRQNVSSWQVAAPTI
jgi:methionine-rich copper-binding protein CopC